MMKSNEYQNMTEWFYQRPGLKKCVVTANRFLPYLMAALFFGVGIGVFWQGGLSQAAFFFGIPAVKFLLCTAIRAAINAPRPYDKYEYQPLVAVEHGKGKSFPSRHTASAFAIARALFCVSIWLGIVGIVLAVLVGILRVITGCHAPKDVLAAVVFVI